jgi:PAS domain S-box-containing protein
MGEALQAVAFTLDVNGNLAGAGSTAFGWWPCTPESWCRKNFLERVAEEDRGRVLDLLQKLPGQTEPVTLRGHILSASGKKVAVSWQARWDEQDRLIYCVMQEHPLQKGQNPLELAPAVKKWYNHMDDILDRIEEGFTILDGEWCIMYTNHGAERISGRKKEDLLGRNLWELFPETKGTIVEEQYRKAVREQTPVRFQTFIPPPYHLWLEIKAYPSHQGLTLFFRDISREKKAEEERSAFQRQMEEQNALLHEILSRISDCFFAVDRNWRVTYWNQKAEEVTGVKSAAILQQHLWEYFSHAVSSPWHDHLQQAFLSQKKTCFEARSTLRPALMEVTVYPSSKGLSVFFKDITHKKAKEEEHQRLSLLARETVNAVSIVDANGQVSWINEAFTRITGYTLPEITIQGHRLLNGPLTDSAVVHKMARRLQQGRPFCGELLIYTRDKKKKWVEVSGQPVGYEQGGLFQYFFIQTDITERKKLERSLREQKSKMTGAVLEGQEKERAQIARELHDGVNQVLTTVKLYNELCMDREKQNAALLQRSVHLLQSCINEIRSLSKRLSAPSLDTSCLGASIRELVKMVSDTNQMQVHLDLGDEDLLSVEENLHLAIYRILQEQLTNILKHAAARVVHVALQKVRNTLVLQVRDDGRGFDTRKKANGIGISNMISRVEAFQGTLQLKSAPGKGCTLIARFPLK